MSTYQLRKWLKNSEAPWAQGLYQQLKKLAQGSINVPLWPYRIFAPVAAAVHFSFTESARIFWHTPSFKLRVTNPPKRLYVYCGRPYVNDALDITLGEACRISGATTFTGRAANIAKARLEIGNNVGIGWQTTIAVGTKVVLADNVRIAGQCFLAGYPGHPINPSLRAQGLADDESQAGDIVLEKNVWLGTGCTLLANVRVGANSIIGAGSVVTKDIPPGVIAAGNPARVIRKLSARELGFTVLTREGVPSC